MFWTVLGLHWLVAAENFMSKDNLTSQALNKLLGLQRTLYHLISVSDHEPRTIKVFVEEKIYTEN